MTQNLVYTTVVFYYGNYDTLETVPHARRVRHDGWKWLVTVF